MTAIAAVIALSSTPLFAQADPAPAAAPPVIVAPPPVTSAAPAISVPAAPASGSGLASVAVPDIATDTGSTVADSSVTAAAVAKPVVRAKPATSSARAETRTESPPPVAEAPAAPIASDKAATVTPAVPAPPPAAVVAAAPAVQPTVAPAPVAQSGDDVAPIAGAAGLGLLALIGGAFAFSRRKRADEEVYAAPEAGIAAPIEPSPEPVFAPVTAAPVIAPAVAPEASVLPNGFDISHHGRHVQAAYARPTPDNPSLSLRKRLKRASFYDQRERMAAAQTPAPAARLPETPAAGRYEQVVPRPAKARKWSLRPAFLS